MKFLYFFLCFVPLELHVHVWGLTHTAAPSATIWSRPKLKLIFLVFLCHYSPRLRRSDSLLSPIGLLGIVSLSAHAVHSAATFYSTECGGSDRKNRSIKLAKHELLRLFSSSPDLSFAARSIKTLIQPRTDRWLRLQFLLSLPLRARISTSWSYFIFRKVWFCRREMRKARKRWKTFIQCASGALNCTGSLNLHRQRKCRSERYHKNIHNCNVLPIHSSVDHFVLVSGALFGLQAARDHR